MIQTIYAIYATLMIILLIFYLICFIISFCYTTFMIHIICMLYKKTGSNYWIPLIPIYGYYKLCEQFNVSKRLTLASCTSIVAIFISFLLVSINSLFLAVVFIVYLVGLIVFFINFIALNESIRLSFRCKDEPMNITKFWIGLLLCRQSIVELAINPKYIYTFGANKSAFLYDEYFYNNDLQNSSLASTNIDASTFSNQKDTKNEDDLFGGKDE